MSDNINVSTDTATPFAHPGWRVAYTIVSWLILGITLSPGNSLFVGIMMLAWGILVDYCKFSPISKFRTYTKIFGCWCSSVLFVINLLASFGTLTVEKINSELCLKVASFPFFVGFYFAVNWYWLITGVFVVFLTIIDWIAESRDLEQHINSPTIVQESAAASELE